MFGIKFNFLSTPVSYSIPSSMSRFLGRSWTYCSTQLSHLILKIAQVVKTRFFRLVPNPIPPLPLPPPGEKKLQVVEPLKVNEPPMTPRIETKVESPHPIIETQATEVANPSIDSSSTSVIGTPLLVNGSLPSSQSTTETFTSTTSHINNTEERRKRREERRKRRSANPLQSSSPPIGSNLSSAPNQQSTVPPETPVQNHSFGQFIAQLFGYESNEKYQLIECGGGGDCQLLSLFKGLELKYPTLLRDLKIKSDLDLRRMGVEFAKQQIDSCGPYHGMVLGYLDSDRKETNEDPEVSVKIATDEEFLKQLSAKGFSCSATHLYALSHLLKIPIEVHDPEGKNQIFNPTQSLLEPVILYHKNKKHFQLKVLR